MGDPFWCTDDSLFNSWPSAFSVYEFEVNGS
jgi:hypothetical protein